MEINREVADAVRAEMARHRITQEKLAAHLHLSQAAVSRRLKGDVGFDAAELVRTARLLCVSPAAFLIISSPVSTSPEVVEAGDHTTPVDPVPDAGSAGVFVAPERRAS